MGSSVSHLGIGMKTEEALKRALGLEDQAASPHSTCKASVEIYLSLVPLQNNNDWTEPCSIVPLL
jgi:hypothetical protein